MEVTFKTTTSPLELLTSEEPILSLLFKGIHFEKKIRAWKKIADVLMNIAKSSSMTAEYVPYLEMISPLFLLEVKTKLKVIVDEKLEAKILEHPLFEMGSADASTLIASFSKVKSDDEEEW